MTFIDEKQTLIMKKSSAFDLFMRDKIIGFHFFFVKTKHKNINHFFNSHHTHLFFHFE